MNLIKFHHGKYSTYRSSNSNRNNYILLLMLVFAGAINNSQLDGGEREKFCL